jgi:hypothetical protein
MWESPTHWPPGSGRPLRRSSPPTHRSAGSSDEDLRSASAIVTAAEPIWATFPARASKSGCRAANRNPPSRRQKHGAGPAGGDGNGADRAPRCERSISAQCERPTPGPRRARCGRVAGRYRRAPARYRNARRAAVTSPVSRTCGYARLRLTREGDTWTVRPSWSKPTSGASRSPPAVGSAKRSRARRCVATA